jgi:rSAM/selenodomain-associated transferase 2
MTSIPGPTGRPISSEPDARPHKQSLTLAVIIPTLNEETALPRLLDSVHAQSQPAQRILVSDAGSTDATLAEARRGGAEVLLSPNRGRGGQVAFGVKSVTEELVLVAHADMVLPAEALSRVRQALADRPDCPGGCLGHRFDRRSLTLRVVQWWDRRRARRGESYGDQAQFFRRQLLQSVGGFPDQPIMEDIELSRRLRTLGMPLYLDVPVTVSARRFVRANWWRIAWTNWSLRRRYRKHGLAVCTELYQRYYPETGEG